jgi:hypothetical protein
MKLCEKFLSESCCLPYDVCRIVFKYSSWFTLSDDSAFGLIGLYLPNSPTPDEPDSAYLSLCIIGLMTQSKKAQVIIKHPFQTS